MTATTATEKYLANLNDERNSAVIYRALAEVVKNPKIAEVYRRLAATEEGHANTWAEKLRAAGASIPPFKPTWRTRALIRLAKRFGVEAVLPTLALTEDRATHGYTQQAGGSAMAPTERSHARLLQQIGQTTQGGMEGSALAQIEGRHRSAGGGALRAGGGGARGAPRRPRP